MISLALHSLVSVSRYYRLGRVIHQSFMFLIGAVFPLLQLIFYTFFHMCEVESNRIDSASNFSESQLNISHSTLSFRPNPSLGFAPQHFSH